MVRNYKKKREKEIDENDITTAVSQVVNGHMKLSEAASAYNIKANTLFYRIKRHNENVKLKSDDFTSKYTVAQIFNKCEEKMLSDYLLKSSKMNYGLTYKQARSLAYQYATALKKCPPQWAENKEAGTDWLKGFMKRHGELSLRKPENTSLSRSTSFNKHNVNQFLDNYAKILSKYKFEPDRIYNLDETNIMTVVQAPNIIAKKGTKQVAQAVSAERGQLITMCGIANAQGNTLPPVFIFPRARFHDSMLHGAPVGSIGYANSPTSGWMTGVLFIKVLEHIKKHTRCTKDDPILILMDNHESHCTLEAINYSRENGIILLTFPPHCTHQMQPLDVAVNGPFKQKLAVAQNDWLLNHPGKTITIHDLASIVTPAYNITYVTRNILSGFSKPGLYPFSRNAFCDEDFECAEVTNRPCPETCTSETVSVPSPSLLSNCNNNNNNWRTFFHTAPSSPKLSRACTMGTRSVLSLVNGFTDNKKRRFPDGFLFGAASAAYQVEGGWNEDGKGESIWDHFMHEDPRMTDIPNGDVASDSYHNYKRDVEMLRELGVDFYRFSISWTRVLPTGLTNQINEAGVEYYNKLINELLTYNIKPMVTLYHFDLPQYLQDLGGWANPLAVTWFEDYARLMFELYGDRVKYWVTVNQPNSICMEGYTGKIAPGVEFRGIGDYLCVKNVLLAHARAYHIYNEDFKPKYKGQVGLVVAVNWIDPLNNKTENLNAAEKARAFDLGLYLDPIYSKSGDFPRIVKETVAKKSVEQGFPRSRLPELTKEEIKLIKGSTDFLGMNHYTTFLAAPAQDSLPVPSYEDDVGASFSQGDLWPKATSSWLRSAPYGMYKALIHLNLNYNYPSIIITEHGWSTDKGLRDQSRADNLRKYLAAILLALEDGTDLRGYTAWSLMDNVEWTMGTNERFGLYQVDYESRNKTRSARLSALVYKHVIETRLVDEEWKPDNLRIRITDRKKKVKTEL